MVPNTGFLRKEPASHPNITYWFRTPGSGIGKFAEPLYRRKLRCGQLESIAKRPRKQAKRAG